jgi:hypothetical protein
VWRLSSESVFKSLKGHVSLELMKGEIADAVLEVIEDNHEDVKVSVLPGYIVIEVPNRIEIDAEEVRECLGKGQWSILDLNEVMPAFSGHFEIYTKDKMVLSWNKK